MSTLEKIAGSMFLLIFAYLLLSNSKGANTLLNTIGSFTTNQTLALQGRNPTVSNNLAFA